MKFVFEITIKPNHTEEEFVQAWQNGSEIIQREPGAMGTRLHKCISAPGKLLAIASWQSKALRDAAMKTLSSNEVTRKLITKHELFGDIRVVGEFEEPTWIVDPPS